MQLFSLIVNTSVHGDLTPRTSYGFRFNAKPQDSSYKSLLTFREHCDDLIGEVLLETFDSLCMRGVPASLSTGIGRLPLFVISLFVFLPFVSLFPSQVKLE